MSGPSADDTGGAEGASQGPEAPKVPESSGIDLARVALRAAKEQAKARGAAAQQKKQAKRGGLRSGARADGRDPLPLGAAINRLITERGWETPAAVGGVMGRWPQIVGDDLAKHCVPQRYDEDARVLTVQCDSTAWATQLAVVGAAVGGSAEYGSGPRHGEAAEGLGARWAAPPVRAAAGAGQQGAGRHVRLMPGPWSLPDAAFEDAPPRLAHAPARPPCSCLLPGSRSAVFPASSACVRCFT